MLPENYERAFVTRAQTYAIKWLDARLAGEYCEFWRVKKKNESEEAAENARRNVEACAGTPCPPQLRSFGSFLPKLVWQNSRNLLA